MIAKLFVPKKNHWMMLMILLISCPGMAWERHQQVLRSSDKPQAHQEKSASVFIKFGDDLRMNFRNGQDITQRQAILEPGSIVQIPTHLAQYNQAGELDLTETLRHWQNLAQYQQKNQGFSHLQSQAWDCEQLGESENAQGRCQGVRNGELFFPIKVVRQGHDRTDISKDEQYGYMALDFLDTEVDPSRYRAGAMTLESALQSTAPVTGGQETTGSSTQGGETTSQESVPLPPNPSLRPEPAATNVYNCSNTTYLTSRQNFTRHSCLRNMNLRQRAELIMKDVLKINQLRNSFNLDPRFSVCIAFRESNMHPNALGGSPDYGMYQVINSTGSGVLRRHPPVTPGFSRYKNSWTAYRDNMIRSTLAQADLHQAVLYQKALEHRLVSRVNQANNNVDVYQTLATRYNGSGPAARNYGRRVANCYRAMLNVANRRGQITNPSRLQAALNKAK